MAEQPKFGDPPADDADEGFSRRHHERTYMFELGQRVRSLREERGLTQNALAKSAGIATDMVSRLENGHYSSPGLRTLLRIADGMGISVGAMLPEAHEVSQATPEGIARAKLSTVVHRARLEDLELLAEIANSVVNRRR
ncbi:MAG: helix-turn-helix transcriptional regulator [Myxococcota bacterium]